jgi:hypothetical protein
VQVVAAAAVAISTALVSGKKCHTKKPIKLLIPFVPLPTVLSASATPEPDGE